MRRIATIVFICILIIMLTSCSRGSRQATNNHTENHTEKYTEAKTKYKLPSEIMYTSESGDVQFHYFYFDFSGKTKAKFSDNKEPYIVTMDNGIIKNVIHQVKEDRFDEISFEYSDDNSLKKMTENSYTGDKEITEVVPSKDKYTFSIFNPLGYSEDVGINVTDKNWIKRVVSLDDISKILEEKEYDKYGNVIGYSNPLYIFYLTDIEYDNRMNIVKANVNLQNLETGKKELSVRTISMKYDSEGYLIESIDSNGEKFNFTYSDYSEEQYQAMKKLSPFVYLFNFQYYNQPLPSFVNYYKY